MEIEIILNIFNCTQSMKDEQALHVAPSKQDVHVHVRDRQESDEVTQREEVSQSVQETTHDWTVPLVQGSITHHQNEVIEQVRTCTCILCVHVHYVCMW